MTRLMYIKASPRTGRSHSMAVAEEFIEAWKARNPSAEVLERDLFAMDLPTFDGVTINGKYNIMHGRDFTPGEQTAWARVVEVIEDFKQADRYVFAVPMWNFNIPYRLKQFIDLVTQPTYTVSMTDKGYEGLLKGRKAFVAYARGGQYPLGTPAEAYDFQSKYFEFWLGFVGITDVASVAAEGMLTPGRDASKSAAVARARELAAAF